MAVEESPKVKVKTAKFVVDGKPKKIKKKKLQNDEGEPKLKKKKVLAEEKGDAENGVQDSAEKPKRMAIRPTILDNFDLIGKDDEAIRVQGCVKLLNNLHSDSEERIKELKYALKRTIRGLGSKQQNTRMGFFATLVGILQSHSSIEIGEIFDLIEKELHMSSNLKSEAGDVFLGQILACGALLRSGLYSKSSDEDKVKIINMLITASKKKVYLVLPSYLFLLDFIEKIPEEEFQLSVWPHLKEEFARPMSAHTLDSLYFVLRLSIKFPFLKKFLKHNIGVNKVIHEDTIHAIAEKLMAPLELSSLNHPIYELFGTEISKSEHLQTFWESGIDTHLKTPNRNRELAAVKLATAIIKNTSADIACVISENFLTRILDRYRSVQIVGKSKKRKRAPTDEDRKMIVAKTKIFFEELGTVLKSDAAAVDLKMAVLNKVFFYPGDILFPQITASSVTRTVIASLPTDGVKKLAKLLKEVLFNESKKRVVGAPERAWVNAERLQAAELLSYLVAHRAVAEETSWRTKYLKYFLQFTVFRTIDGENSDVSPTLAAAVKNCFYRSLNCKLAKLNQRLNILRELAVYIDKQLLNEETASKATKIFSDENQEKWKSMRKFTTKLEKSLEKNETKENEVFLILSLQLGLYLFSDAKNVELAKSSLDELQSCYKNYKKGGKSAEDSDDAPQWIEVLIEVILSILSHDCNLLRSLVGGVFPHLCVSLTPSALGQIVSVLDPDENPLSKNDDADESEESDDDDADDKAENGDNNVENGDDKAESSDDDDENAQSDDDEEMKVSDQFRLAIRTALGNAAPDTDTESVDADMIEEEEGKRIDKALGEAFKMLRQSKNKKTKSERKDDIVLIHFRIRILDLIDIYTEKTISMDNCLNMLKPLLKCLEFAIKDAEQKPLEMRLRKSIKTITGLKSFTENDVSAAALAEYFQSILDKATRSQFVYQAIGDKIAECSAFVARCAQNIAKAKSPKKQGKVHQPLVDIFSESLESFFKNRSCLYPIIMFHSTLRTDWDGNWFLLPVIAENVFDSKVRQFRKNEGLQLLQNFYIGITHPKSSEIEDRLIAFESLLSNHIIESLNNDEYVESCKTEHFYTTLLQLLSRIKIMHRIASIKENHIDWNRIKEAFLGIQTKQNWKNKNQFKKLYAAVGF